MVTRRCQVAVLVSDEDDRALRQLDADPQARQLLRWFEQLPPAARAEVHALARRHASQTRSTFEVVSPGQRARAAWHTTTRP